MDILKWVLVGILGLSAICNILFIDQPRTPITRGSSALAVIINAGLIYWILNTL